MKLTIREGFLEEESPELKSESRDVHHAEGWGLVFYAEGTARAKAQKSQSVEVFRHRKQLRGLDF